MELETVWNGCRDNPRMNGGYLNLQFFPKRDAPKLPRLEELPRIPRVLAKNAFPSALTGCRRHRVHIGAELVEKLARMLMSRAYTVQELSAAMNVTQRSIYWALTKLRGLKRRHAAKTKGRPVAQFWLERG
jgi:hypothetical protein